MLVSSTSITDNMHRIRLQAFRLEPVMARPRKRSDVPFCDPKGPRSSKTTLNRASEAHVNGAPTAIEIYGISVTLFAPPKTIHPIAPAKGEPGFLNESGRFPSVNWCNIFAFEFPFGSVLL